MIKKSQKKNLFYLQDTHISPMPLYLNRKEELMLKKALNNTEYTVIEGLGAMRLRDLLDKVSPLQPEWRFQIGIRMYMFWFRTGKWLRDRLGRLLGLPKSKNWII